MEEARTGGRMAVEWVVGVDNTEWKAQLLDAIF